MLVPPHTMTVYTTGKHTPTQCTFYNRRLNMRQTASDLSENCRWLPGLYGTTVHSKFATTTPSRRGLTSCAVQMLQTWPSPATGRYYHSVSNTMCEPEDQAKIRTAKTSTASSGLAMCTSLVCLQLIKLCSIHESANHRHSCCSSSQPLPSLQPSQHVRHIIPLP